MDLKDKIEMIFATGGGLVMNKLMVIVVLVAGLFSNGFAQEISVRLSDNKVGINESFTAVFSIGQKIYDQPDFSPLLNDFDILSSSGSTSTTIINGKVTEEIRWTLRLIAKHEGKLKFPSIFVGSIKSLPKEIEVIAGTALKEDDAIFIEIEKKPITSIYKQTPLICTVRLYCSLHMTQGKLSELETNDSNALIERIGTDAQFEKFHNGKRYMVIERQYMIMPEQIGELIIKPIVFEGHVMGKSYSMFDAQTNFKRVYSLPEKVDVKALPEGFNKNKLVAANDLKLTESFSKEPSNLSLGEPVTWTITIKAEGTIADSIPDFALKFPKDMKSYIDKPELSDQITASGMIATKEIKVALIPTKPGVYLLPDLTIEWWDLNIDQKRETKLLGRTIQVTSEEIALADPVTPVTTEIINPVIVEVPDNEAFTEPLDQDEASNLFVGLIGLTALLLLLGFYIKTKPRNSRGHAFKQIKKGLKHACRINDSKKAEKYLLALAGLMFPEIKPLNLMTIKPYLTDCLQHEIDELSKDLYGRNKNWDGSTLWNAWVTFKPKKHSKFRAKQNNDELKELYPK